MNLEVDLSRGRYRLGVTGCDYRFATGGGARLEGDAILLTPDKPEAAWPSGGSYAASVKPPLTLRRLGDGFQIEVSSERAREPQAWSVGGVCTSCAARTEGPPLGTTPCSEPFLGPT